MGKKIISLKESKVFYIMIFLIFLPLVAFADSALQWDRNDDADYYVVYWGTSPGDYSEGHSSAIDFDTTGFQLVASEGTQTFYYAVKAFNQCGNSSDFSDEVATAYIPDNSYDRGTNKSNSSSIIDSKIKSEGEDESGGCFIYSATK